MNQSAAISLLQVTDMHILAEPNDTLLGVNTAQSFQAVLDLAFTSGETFDALLLTGDLAQDPCAASYQHILHTLQVYDLPCICLAGNHDDAGLMQDILATEQINCAKQVFFGNWQLISLNSQIVASPAGALSAEELAWLDCCLAAHPDKFALIAVHHHCLASDSAWMDTMMIANSAEFLAQLAQYPQVKVITHGHVHQVLDNQIGAIRVLGTPSTCFQFQANSTSFTIDTTAAPAYRWLRLFADGHIETDIVRLPEPLTGLSTSTHGY